MPVSEPTEIVSTGTKLTWPVELLAYRVFSVRALPNPHYEVSLRARDGRDAEVKNYVVRNPYAQDLLQHALVEVRQNRPVAFLCFGGRHRSVAMAEELASMARAEGLNVTVKHWGLGER